MKDVKSKFPGEAYRIARILSERFGPLEYSADDAAKIWQEYSALQGCDWHGLPKEDSEIERLIKPYVTRCKCCGKYTP